MNGIPDPGGASGTFAALERTTPIVQMGDGDEPTTTSMRIANGTQHEHRAVLKLIRENTADFEEFGRVALEVQPFDTTGGTQTREVAILNEAQATLLMTFMRNLGVVKDFKKRLVREFYEMRRATSAPAPAAIPTHSEALRGWAAEIEARELAESRARELAVPASAWNELAEAAGDYSVADAAKVLSRDPNISTGERRLFKQMQGLGWVYRRDGHWTAYQAQVERGRLVEKVNRPFERNGEMVAPAPTIRITPKGLQDLHHRLGGGGAQMTLAAAE